MSAWMFIKNPSQWPTPLRTETAKSSPWGALALGSVTSTNKPKAPIKLSKRYFAEGTVRSATTRTGNELPMIYAEPQPKRYAPGLFSPHVKPWLQFLPGGDSSIHEPLTAYDRFPPESRRRPHGSWWDWSLPCEGRPPGLENARCVQVSRSILGHWQSG